MLKPALLKLRQNTSKKYKRAEFNPRRKVKKD